MAFKEIVTKAVVGKGKKHFTNSYSIDTPNNPSTVLGCWVINHKFKGFKSTGKVGVDGSFDVNIWYSYENDSKTTVINQKITYNDLFNVTVRENADLSSDTDVIVRCLKGPNCTKVNIDNGKINFDIEKELGVELVGETKMRIDTLEEDDEWEEIVDIDDTLKEIDNVDENYMEST